MSEHFPSLPEAVLAAANQLGPGWRRMIYRRIRK